MGARVTSIKALPIQLRRTENAPLKPPQKLSIIKHYLQPCHIYGLQNPEIKSKVLNSADRLIRLSIKKILHLPKQAPNATLYAPIKRGGLGIFSFRSRIPGILLSRLQKLGTLQDLQIDVVLGTQYVTHLYDRLQG